MPSPRFQSFLHSPKFAPAMAILVFLLALVCYWPSMHGELLWDDPAHVTKQELQSLEGLGRIWTDVLATQQYYPVLHSAFWLQHQIWGDSTFAYHLNNTLQHALAACLLAMLLRRLWFRPSSGDETSASKPRFQIPPGAEWLAAILFVVHPVCVESVAWISEQKNTLSLVFYLLAALAYLRFYETRNKLHYALAALPFVLALLTKTVTATLPAALLVVIWWKNGALSWRRDVKPLLPWFALALVSGLSTAWIEKNLIGADGAGYDLDLLERTLLASRIVWFYLGSFAWPTDLAFFYELWDVPALAMGWIGYLAAALVLTAGLWWLSRREARGPLAVWLLFVGSLFPALGFVNVFPFAFSYTADHFQYLANLSLFAGAPAAVSLLLVSLPKIGRLLLGGFVALLVFALIGLAREQSALYVNNETLFRATVERTDNWMAHRILAWSLSKKDGYEKEAISHYERAIELNPGSPDAHYGYGLMLDRIPGRQADAQRQFLRAIELRPNFAEALHSLGSKIAKNPQGQEQAIELFETAIESNPLYSPPHYELAKLLTKIPNRWPEGMAHFEEALRLEPDNASYHQAYGHEMAKIAPRRAEAIEHLRRALELDPSYGPTYYSLALALTPQPENYPEAVALFQKALEHDPTNLEAHNGLAFIYVQTGRPQLAESHWKRALEIDPTFETARKNLVRLEQLKNR
ncbi:tetratricopeptide repeat protein [Pelagicoccus sp. SDUM812003]|uniref:tetratricopeptide repeat protein n=1 Tax=Pelagicoccus sp. SDUM812003 TaxID=3041267 RepID=UPI00280F278A|nr:tetratricopeptide repeat protein [Pelagicoccus sp. SDUM812003]MDQ8205515.1 tetratricopeptide repeat protein [Pelagicoccus sp. SDUM812003]